MFTYFMIKIKVLNKYILDIVYKIRNRILIQNKKLLLNILILFMHLKSSFFVMLKTIDFF